MNTIVEDLLLLHNLELGCPEPTPEVKELRKKIPSKELLQYDRLRHRGKKGVALVRNGVCTGCHIHMPTAKINSLISGKGSMTCDNCGCFLYLSPEQRELFQQQKSSAAIAAAH